MKRISQSLYVKAFALLAMLLLTAIVSPASTYIVAVGINEYEYVTSLHVSEDDARSFAQTCRAYPDNHVVLVTGNKATRANLINVIGQHFAKAKADDSLIFFFSGHGVGGGVVAYDTEDESEQSILSYKTLARLMKRSPATRKVIIIDSCHSGSSRNTTSTGKKVKHSIGDPNTILFMSSRSNEYSLEVEGMSQSLFTYHLLRGMRGGADTNKDRYVTAKELFRYVSSGVRRDSGEQQHPVMWGNFDAEFVIMKY